LASVPEFLDLPLKLLQINSLKEEKQKTKGQKTREQNGILLWHSFTSKIVLWVFRKLACHYLDLLGSHREERHTIGSMDIEQRERALLRKTQMKVLALFGAAAVLALVFAYWLGAFGLGSSYQIDLRYRFAGGIDKGSPVRLGGIRVGRVSGVKFVDDPEANIQVSIKLSPDAFAQITSDSNFYINLAGLIGERYVEVVTGGGSKVEDGMTLRGIDPPRIDQLISQGYGFFEDVRSFFNENKTELGELLSSLNALSQNMNTMLGGKNGKSFVNGAKGINQLSQELLVLVKKVNKGFSYMEDHEIGTTYKDLQSLLSKGNKIHVNDIRRLMLEDGVHVNFGSKKIPRAPGEKWELPTEERNSSK